MVRVGSWIVWYGVECINYEVYMFFIEIIKGGLISYVVVMVI